MNQKNAWYPSKQSCSVDLTGNMINPMDEIEMLTHEYAIAAWMIDDRATFDGFSLVLPLEPKPILVKGKELYVVVGIHNGCLKHPRDVDQDDAWEATSSPEWIADWISLGKPHCGPNPRVTGMYWIALHHEPVSPRFKSNNTVFSYGGVVALTQMEDEGDIRLLSLDALKTLNTWSKDGEVSSWF
ncbi:hypothetical protein G6722_07740 [Polynucleobacter paneuropaeus]|nr:hypothetical protein [Polynucleobacter paneuropaeus]